MSSYSLKHLILHQAYQIQPAKISIINLISKVKLRMALLSSTIVYVFVSIRKEKHSFMNYIQKQDQEAHVPHLT